VPDTSQFPPPHQPRQAYIYTERDVVRLLSAADNLASTPGSPLRSQTYRLAIVLLYTTGIRRGELVRLRVGDYALAERTLLIRETKFHKSRLMPLSEDGYREVDGYLQARRRAGFPASADAPLLWNRYPGGPGYCGAGLGQGLRTLLTLANIHTPSGRLPRVHDFRHTFAVGALVRWYRCGADVQAKLPILAAYMGHGSICSTEHYLHFVEDLRVAASQRFLCRFADLISAPAPTSGGGP
jgi:integrase